MRQIIIQLDDTSVSFCHYLGKSGSRKLISLENLDRAISIAQRENFSVQVLFPEYQLPDEYLRLLKKINFAKICSSRYSDSSSDVIVFENLDELREFIQTPNDGAVYVLKITREDYESFADTISSCTIPHRLNVILKDIAELSDSDLTLYEEKVLVPLREFIQGEYEKKHFIEVNIITDRIFYDRMNNCNAGIDHLTMAPDGNFYVCPAFYYEGKDDNVLKDICDLKNSRLFSIKYSPICRHCDSFQCKRCVWLNKRLTGEVNTPSHQQCVASHLERRQSIKMRTYLQDFLKISIENSIPDLDYLDPYDNYKQW